MKRVLGILVCLGVMVSTSMAWAETYRLTYSSFFPPAHVQSKLAEAWAKEVEQRTAGAVVIDFYPAGTLTKAKQVYDGVVQGISDLGLSALAYSRGRFPLMEAVDLPLGYSSGTAATQVANSVYRQFTPKELDDVHVLYFHAHGPGLLHTREKAVRTMEDMQGMKLRATGNSAKVVKALGAIPVAMSMPESYQSIQRGVVDGGMYPVETNKGWKMAEVVDYCTKAVPVAYTTTFFVVMNKNRWNEFPPELQSTITQVSREWEAKHGAAWDESDAAGKEYFTKQGNSIIELDDTEIARWKLAVEPIIEEYQTQAAARNVEGKAVVDFIRQQLATGQ
ncbi:TRAP transporter substrate-binding protein [Oleidesulfovibrio sp.]|uniref:TRAP transporter substrate-binding protein n=1 Tax=Oleidesulfovibrio sp. TaxID=2909707 RepID=UPI003A8C6D6B